MIWIVFLLLPLLHTHFCVSIYMFVFVCVFVYEFECDQMMGFLLQRREFS